MKYELGKFNLTKRKAAILGIMPHQPNPKFLNILNSEKFPLWDGLKFPRLFYVPARCQRSWAAFFYWGQSLQSFHLHQVSSSVTRCFELLSFGSPHVATSILKGLAKNRLHENWKQLKLHIFFLQYPGACILVSELTG